jgi:glycosyltransferase involved in cell wall biosynthesis
MASPIVFDLLRLFLSTSATTPRGIDRIDLAYARFLFATWPDDCFGLLPTPWGLRLYPRERVLRGLDVVETMWRERSAGPDAAFSSVIGRLGGGAALQVRHRPSGETPLAAYRLARFLSATGMAAGAPAIRATPRGAVYVNIGQLGWAAPWMASWLGHRQDVRAVFMLHDAIPAERPDLVTSLGSKMYRRMMAVAARHAAGLIFTTQAARASVLRVLRGLRPDGHPLPMTTSKHLPVAPSFLTPARPDPGLAEHAYFVVVGSIEKRKNHMMLLKVWSDLFRRRGARTPRLVVAGSPGRGGQSILDQLEGCGDLRDRVIVAPSLSSPALRQLMANARAVLMPSLAEGFGLPIIEALTVGTPVLASDLAAHREVGGKLAIYLDPTDDSGWLREVDRFADGDDSTDALRRRIMGYDPTTPADYFSGIAGFLQNIHLSGAVSG